jgi:hypothetical protein
LAWGVVPPSTYYYSTEQSFVDAVSTLLTKDITGEESVQVPRVVVEI